MVPKWYITIRIYPLSSSKKHTKSWKLDCSCTQVGEEVNAFTQTGPLKEVFWSTRQYASFNYLCMQLKCLLSTTGNQKWYKLISMCQICTDAECSQNKHLNPAIKSLNAHLFAFSYLITI